MFELIVYCSSPSVFFFRESGKYTFHPFASSFHGFINGVCGVPYASMVFERFSGSAFQFLYRSVRVSEVQAAGLVGVLIVVTGYGCTRFFVVNRGNFCGRMFFDTRVLNFICSGGDLSCFIKFGFSVVGRFDDFFCGILNVFGVTCPSR